MNRNKKKKEWWWASQIALKLDYKDKSSFFGVLNKTIQTFTILDIPLFENVIFEMNGNRQDCKLSRFASYIVALHADSKKETVNRAKYNISRKTGLSTKTLLELERVSLREELSEANKWLSSIAKKAGVTDYGAFVNAGYLGMYNMQNKQLAEYKKQDTSVNLLDMMGKIELSANLLRISMCEKAIKLNKIIGQVPLEKLHQNIGVNIRKSIIQSLKTYPEELPVERNIEQIKKELKDIYNSISIE